MSSSISTSALMPRRGRLSLRILLSFVVLLGVMLLGIWGLGRVIGYQEFLEDAQGDQYMAAQRFFIDLRAEMESVQVLARSLAVLGEREREHIDHLRHIIPELINHPVLRDVVAGGGIWPEPFAFDKEKERNSFFWGREPDGSLKFYDDYNDPNGRGYHQEEWYVPTQFARSGTCYWSRSYVDPYSKTPMVTCSVKMMEGDTFLGVATIDLKLSGLAAKLKQASDHVGGYALLVDRENRVIIPPRNISVEGGVKLPALLAAAPHLDPIIKKLDKVNAWLAKEATTTSARQKMMMDIDTASDQINVEESALITTILTDLEHADHRGAADDKVDQFLYERTDIPNDPILGERGDVHAFVDHENHWKLAFILPQSALTRQIDESVMPLVVSLAVLAAILLAAFFGLIRHWVLVPLSRMIAALNDQQKNGPTPHNHLDETLSTELGIIARLFNARTDDMNAAVDRAIEASAAKSDFLSHMSHELRTPLNSIIGMSQLIDRKTLPKDTGDMIAIMSQSAHSLLAIVNDILDLSKIEAGEVMLQYTGFYVVETLKHTIQTMLPLASQKGLRLEYSLPDTDTYVLSDPLRVSRVLTNLIANAIRYTERGWVKVTVTTEKIFTDKILLRAEVSDTGIGIPKDRQEKVFEKFAQADSKTANYGGTGLGLTITKELLELMDGHIGLDSTVGVGSTFWFTLPLEVSSARVSGAVDPTRDALLALTKIARHKAADVHILVAEDHMMNQQFVRRLFQNLGIKHYKIAPNGQEAVAELERTPYDIVLMDCHMPIMDGYQATQMIRAMADPGMRSIPIIAMTANAMREDEEKCLAVGMNAYISKPIIIDDFKRKLSTWVDLTAPVEAAPNTPQDPS